MLSSGGLNLHRDQVDQWSQWTAVFDRMTLTLICTTFTLSMLNHGLGCPYARGGGRVSLYRPIFGPRQRIARIGTYRVS